VRDPSIGGGPHGTIGDVARTLQPEDNTLRVLLGCGAMTCGGGQQGQLIICSDLRDEEGVGMWADIGSDPSTTGDVTRALQPVDNTLRLLLGCGAMTFGGGQQGELITCSDLRDEEGVSMWADIGSDLSTIGDVTRTLQPVDNTLRVLLGAGAMTRGGGQQGELIICSEVRDEEGVSMWADIGSEPSTLSTSSVVDASEGGAWVSERLDDPVPSSSFVLDEDSDLKSWYVEPVSLTRPRSASTVSVKRRLGDAESSFSHEH